VEVACGFIIFEEGLPGEQKAIGKGKGRVCWPDAHLSVFLHIIVVSD
jgi:hypothetical protein